MTFIIIYLIFCAIFIIAVSQRNIQEEHECECALPILKATKYALTFKTIIYITFLFS